MSTHVAVTQSVLAWALQRTDRSYEKTVKKFPKLGAWLSGDALPSLRELEKFASFTHVTATSNSRTGTTIMLVNRGLRNFHSSVP